MTVTHYRLLAICWTVAIFVAYSIPTPDVSPQTAVQLDKAAHFGMFLGFGFLWMHALHPRRSHRGRKVASWRRTALLLAIGVGLSALAEVYQILLPARAADPYDAAANLIGLLSAVGFFWWRHPPTASPRNDNS